MAIVTRKGKIRGISAPSSGSANVSMDYLTDDPPPTRTITVDLVVAVPSGAWDMLRDARRDREEILVTYDDSSSPSPVARVSA